MHPTAYRFVMREAERLPGNLSVVEIGGRDINGSVRKLFRTSQYTSIDLYPGPGVDVVADATQWRPAEPVDVVVCCEVLEHVQHADRVVASTQEMLRPGGFLIITCATDPRVPHSGIDGGRVRPSEWYKNICPELLEVWMQPLEVRTFEVHTLRGDIYAAASTRKMPWDPME